jgi:RimJ/RimL family protein N-acetyltransferase
VRVTETPIDVVELRVGDYLLDAPRPDDVDVLVRALADPEIALWNPASSTPADSAQDRAERWIADRAAWAADHASWVVRDRDSHLLGAVSLHHIDPAMATAEIGYWMAPDGRERGLGTAATAAAAAFGFEQRGLVRIELYHGVENEASCRLATRCGFRLEGTTRSSFVYGDSRRHDEHLHGRLSTDPYPAIAPPR